MKRYNCSLREAFSVASFPFHSQGLSVLIVLFLFVLFPFSFFSCGEPPGYLALHFVQGPPYGEEGKGRSLPPLASEADTTVYLRWEGPSSGVLEVPFSAHRAEIRGVAPGTYTIGISAAENRTTIFAITITATVVSGKSTTITIPIGAFR